MEDTMGDVVIVYQIENLGLVYITGISPGVEYSVHVQGKGLPIIGIQTRLMSTPDALPAFCCHG